MGIFGFGDIYPIRFRTFKIRACQNTFHCAFGIKWGARTHMGDDYSKSILSTVGIPLPKFKQRPFMVPVDIIEPHTGYMGDGFFEPNPLISPHCKSHCEKNRKTEMGGGLY